MAQHRPFSDYVVYVDESGDHGIEALDPQYPVFVLAFCVFHKRHYNEKVVPALQAFKFKHFGHDTVVLHEHEIRKEKGDFRLFRDRSHKQSFIQELHDVIETSHFILISCVVRKSALQGRGEGTNPYHIALGHCLETLHELMQEKAQHERLTHVVVESRGAKEDKELELKFRRTCDGANRWGRILAFDVVFANKQTNSSGLQLADLVARPVGLGVLRPEQVNRAFDVLKRKFFCAGGRADVGNGFEGWGLKVYPAPESEKPR